MNHRIKNLLIIGILASGLLVPGCEDAVEEAQLAGDREEDDGLTRLRSTQSLRFQVGTTELEVVPNGVTPVGTTQMSLNTFRDRVVTPTCQEQLLRAHGFTGPWTGAAYTCTVYPNPTSGPHPGWCQGAVTCGLERSVCEMNVYAEIANLVGPRSFRYRATSGGTVQAATLQPLAIEDRALLLEYAISQASTSVGALQALLGLVQPSAPPEYCSLSFAPNLTNGQALTVFLEDWWTTVGEIARGSAAAYADLAETQPSQWAEARLAAEAAVQIRRHAANILVGTELTSAIASPVLCGVATLNAQERAALSILRQSGVNPSRVRALPDRSSTPLTLAQLLTHSDRVSGPSEGVILRYLAATSQLRAHYNDQTGLLTLPTPSEFIAGEGLEERHFERARVYLADESAAYRRDLTQLGAPFVIPSDLSMAANVNVARFAATTNPVNAQSWLLHARPRSSSGTASLNSVYGIAGRIAQRIVSDLSDDLPAPVAADMSRAAGQLHALAYSENRGTLRVTASSGLVEFFDVARVDRTRLRLARSQATLQCATIGSNEGEECTAANLPTIVFGAGAEATDPVTLRSSLRSTVTLPGAPLPAGTTLYLLEQLPGAPAGDIRSYRELGVIEVPVGGAATSQSITPSLAFEASEYLQPSPQDCGEVRSTCAGADLDGPLPLEDSLTDDGNGVESSWQRYLVRARDAAERADEYGRRAFEAQLEVERRAEAAVEELQALCGSTVNAAPLLDVDPAQECPDARTPFEIVDCLATRFGDVGLDDLRECLDSTRVRDFVSIGSSELCIWHPTGRRRDVCGLATGTPATAVGTLSCPRLLSPADQAGGDAYCEAPAGHVGYRLRGLDLLNVFSRSGDAPPPPPPPNPQLCNDLRSLRADLAVLPPDTTNSVQHTLLRARWTRVMSRSGLLALSNLERAAALVSYEARPGGYSNLTVGEGSLIRTGDIATGPSNSGVCGPNGMDASRCSGNFDGSLFCSPSGCSNTRLATAATNVRWLGQRDLTGFIVEQRWNSLKSPSLATYFDDYLTRPVGRRTFTVPAQGTGYCSDVGGWPADTNCQSGPYAAFVEIAHTRPFGGGNLGAGNQARGIRTAVAFADALSVPVGPASRLLGSSPLPPGEWNAMDYFLAYGGYSAFIHPYFAAGINCPECGLMPLAQDGYGGGDGRPYGVPTEAHYVPTWSQIFDALEVVCEAGRQGLNAPVVQPIENISEDDLPTVLDQLRQGADDVASRAGMFVFTGVPQSVADSVRGERLAGTTAGAGVYGAESTALEAAMVGLHTIPNQIAGEVRHAERSLRLATEQLEIIAAERRIDTRQFRIAAAQAGAACASALANAAGASGFSKVASFAGAAGVCAAQFAIIAVERKQLSERLGILDSQQAIALISLEGELDAVGVSLNRHAIQLRSDAASLSTALTQLEGVRRQADRALAKLLFLDTDGAGAAVAMSGQLRNRLSVERARYQRAKTDAIRLAYIARRAIEQRFGINMNEMRQQMTLVPAPAGWASSVCGLEGLAYGELAAEDEAFAGAAAQTSPFVGDYVTLLENFVDSYRLDYPFSDGADMAVVSLRDDVAQVRDYCEVASGNLLYHSTSLGHTSNEDGPGWEALGCDEAGDYAAPCIGVTESDMVAPPGGLRGAPVAEVVTFAPGHPACPGVDCPCITAAGVQDVACGWRAGARWGQWVRLPFGTYRMSWYEPADEGALEAAFNVYSSSGAVLPILGQRESEYVDPQEDPTWRHRWFDFQIDREADVFVGFGAARVAGDEVTVAGPMLESVSRTLAGGYPGVFGATGADLLILQQACDDTDGDVFRRVSWRRGCVVLCGDGFEGSCLPSDRREHCYREMSFDISHQGIEQDGALSQAGFAYGNFNYRTDWLAVNLVGTAIRDCSTSSSPSTCYSNATVPFSLTHRGPHDVRSYDGAFVDADIFPATIEHGRALAADRYATNPMSTGDSSLLMPLSSTQFRGRPLTGSYTLRIWEDEGVRFDHLEDVQVVLGYGYWTRSN